MFPEVVLLQVASLGVGRVAQVAAVRLASIMRPEVVLHIAALGAYLVAPLVLANEDGPEILCVLVVDLLHLEPL